MEQGSIVLFKLNDDPMSRERDYGEVVEVNGNYVTINYNDKQYIRPVVECVATSVD